MRSQFSFSCPLRAHFVQSPGTKPAHTYFSFSCPTSAPPVQRVPGPPNSYPVSSPATSSRNTLCKDPGISQLYLLQLQLSCQGALCAFCAPGTPSMHTLQFQLSCQDTLFKESSDTSWSTHPSAPATLPGHPGMSQAHFSFSYLQHTLNTYKPETLWPCITSPLAVLIGCPLHGRLQNPHPTVTIAPVTQQNHQSHTVYSHTQDHPFKFKRSNCST